MAKVVSLPDTSNFTLLEKISYFWVTFGYSGTITRMPGTIGSLVATILAYLLFSFGVNLLIVTLLLLIIGLITTHIIEKKLQLHDPSWIVIDEAIAIFFLAFCYAITTMLIPPATANDFALTSSIFKVSDIVNFTIIFVVFRFFDICKPGIIGVVDRKYHNSVMTTVDDLLAAVIALPVVLICIYFVSFII